MNILPAIESFGKVSEELQIGIVGYKHEWSVTNLQPDTGVVTNLIKIR